MTSPIPLPIPGPISLENWGVPLTQRVNDLSSVGAISVAEAVLTASSAGIAGTETIVHTCSFTAAATVRYQAIGGFQFNGSTAGDFFIVRFRWAAGPTVTTAGAVIVTRGLNIPVANMSPTFYLARGWTPGVSGQVTVGASIQRTAGSGTMLMAGGANADSLIEVERRS